MAISKVVRWRNATPDTPQYIAGRIEETCHVEVVRDVAVVPYNLEIRTHRASARAGLTDQVTQRTLTTIRSNVDAQVYLIEHNQPALANPTVAAAGESSNSSSAYDVRILANASEVVPYLAGKDSPFIRQAKAAEQPEDGFRNVANMTASTLALPGTKKAPTATNAQPSGPQLIPGQAAIVPGFQYSVKLAGKSSEVEWIVRVFLPSSVSRSQAAMASPDFGAIVQVVHCPIDSNALPEPVANGILDAFLASLLPMPSAFAPPDQLRLPVVDVLSIDQAEWTDMVHESVTSQLQQASSDTVKAMFLLLRAIREG